MQDLNCAEQKGLLQNLDPKQALDGIVFMHL
jgi:hypothetical protein